MDCKMIPRRWMWPILIGILILVVPGLPFAKESRLIYTQGLINPGGNLKAGYLLINEMKVYLDASTSIKDVWGNGIPATELKAKKWVYLEMERGRKNQLTARVIHLLPHHVKPEERKKFAFMK